MQEEIRASLSPLCEMLNTRIAYVQAELANVLTRSDVERVQMDEVLMDAEACGHCYFRNDEHEPPFLFRDEPALLEAWHFGYERAAAFAEMDECSSCNDGTGNPCLVHG